MRSLEEIQAANDKAVKDAMERKRARTRPNKGEGTLTVEVPRTRHRPDALFFREVWMNGTGDDGSKIELTRTGGGGALYLKLEINHADGTRIVETIDMIPLVQAWANAINNEKEN